MKVYNFGDKENILNLRNMVINKPSKGVDANDSLLNAIFGGFKPQTLTIVSANSNGGKTTFLVQQTIKLCFKHHKKILFVSIEQGTEEMYKLFLSCLTHVERNHIYSDESTQEDIDTLNLIDSFQDLYFCYMPDISTSTINSLRSYIKTLGIEYLIFDYISSELSIYDDTNKVISGRDDLVLKNLTTILKQVAVELNIAVISATQLNNSPRDKNNKMRDASWLRGSFAIADKCDVGMILDGKFNEYEKKLVANSNPYFGLGDSNLVIDIYKNRYGPKDIKVFRKINFATFEYVDIAVYDTNENNLSNTYREKMKNDKC